MPKGIPSGLYMEGAVALDTQPFANMYHQYMMRQQAKDEALDKYFQDFGKSITPAGMRNQDIPVLTDKTNEWRNFYTQNREKISNPRLDGGKAYSEYMSRYQDQLQTIQQSKNAADITKQLGQLRADPKKAELLTEESLQSMASHDKALNDPEHKTFDLNSLTYKPEPFDAKMREGVYRSLTAGLTPSKIAGAPIGLPNFQIKTPYTQQFSPEDIKAIGNRAIAFADSDKSIKYYADKELLPSLLKDPQKFNELNSAFKNVYGRDAQSGQELFAAQSILDLNRKSVEEKVEADVYGRERAMQALRHADAKDLIKYKKEIDPNDTDLNNTWVESYLGKLVSEASKKPGVDYKFNEGGKVTEYNIPVDPVLGKALAEGNVSPDAVRVDANGNFRRIFFKRYGKGEVEGKQEGEVKRGPGGIAVDEELSRVKLSPDQVALALGYKGQSKKQLAETMQSVLGNKSKSSKSSFAIDGKSYSRKQLNDLGYDDKEIEQAIKAGIIK